MRPLVILIILTLLATTALAGETRYALDGKRLDAGSSRGRLNSPPPNTERQLHRETSRLTPYQHSATETVSETVTTVELKQVFDSTKTPPFVSGESTLTATLENDLRMLAAQLRGRKNLKLAISGHTDSVPLAASKRKIYRDNYGLGRARALKTAEFIAPLLGLAPGLIEISSYGPSRPVAGNSTPSGRARNRRVEISISFDREVTIEKTVTRERPVPKPEPLRSCDDVLSRTIAAAQQPFRISVDGVPLDDMGTTDPDIQRCTDLALEQADLQVRYDSLELAPSLNLSATPNSAVRGQKVTFSAYSNYDYWIARREVRIFPDYGSTQGKPLKVIPMTAGQAHWVPAKNAPNRVKYLLRVYDHQGRFDETAPKPLKIDRKAKPLAALDSALRETLIGYGENSLRLRNIPVRGGSIIANGSKLPPASQVMLMGQPVPLDKNGTFAVRQILPSGSHTVDLQVDTDQGRLNFKRNLYIPDNDWFYIAIADLFGGENRTSGPARLVTGDTQHYDDKAYVDGRLAFYLKGKIKGEWLLTAAADTREQPLDELFSNVDSKDPRYLLRRLDPDRYYPVYGDDSTTVEDAPTRGKFYVKLERGDDHVMWGNFQTRWSGTEFANYNRGMYGAGARWSSEQQTAYGEQRAEADLFAGDPGTLDARDEFRGTGGSLYYLRHLDVTLGSEKIWVEVRDKDSGLVIETRQLTAGQDYDINFIQGRVLLTAPLASLADDNQLVQTGSLSGHPQYLVATYEYVPGLSEIDNMTLGGRASGWINDHVKVGVTAYRQGDDAVEQKLGEADVTLLYAPGTYIRGEVARSDGPGSGNSISGTGGFEFNSNSAVDTEATAQRVEVAVDLAEISEGKGRVSAYWQDREEGFSGPGQIASEDISQFGAAVETDVTEKLTVSARADVNDSDSRETTAVQTTASYQVNENWQVALGGRFDDLDSASSSADNSGQRTDLSGKVEYRPDADSDNPDWALFGFVQGTASRSDDRDENNRVGLGGRYKVSDPLTLSGEISEGNHGFGGKAGADWRVNERSQLYMNYALDSDRTDDLYRGRQGRLTSGGRTRYSDSLSIYAEERLQHGAGPSGLIHAFGLDLAALDSWNFGLKFETGELSEPDDEDLERTAVSFSAGYARDKTRYAGNLEWRKDDGTTSGKRTTWLMRNSFGYQTHVDWRLLAKLNFSLSDSDQGDFYDADFVEAVLGYAYRPVYNDRLNALFKYTLFYDLPSAGALTSSQELADYAQRSHILSADAIYDLVPWLSVGAKYGYRRGEVRENRDGGDWSGSNAHLAVLRSDWHFVHKWDAVLEARWLRVSAADDERVGALVAVYRHLGRNIKLGVGYNFSDFSDDLTDQDYDSRGWFLNLTGKL